MLLMMVRFGAQIFNLRPAEPETRGEMTAVSFVGVKHSPYKGKSMSSNLIPPIFF